MDLPFPLDPVLLKKTGIFALVSGEVVALVAGFGWIGSWLDERWATKPYLATTLALVGFGVAVWRIRWYGQRANQ